MIGDVCMCERARKRKIVKERYFLKLLMRYLDSREKNSHVHNTQFYIKL